MALAERVSDACAESDTSNFKFLYPLEKSIKEKINTIAYEMYGAAGVEFMDKAEEQIA